MNHHHRNKVPFRTAAGSKPDFRLRSLPAAAAATLTLNPKPLHPSPKPLNRGKQVKALLGAFDFELLFPTASPGLCLKAYTRGYTAYG